MKSTKKTLAISTIVMVAVLIVALSTATFAWYTAQSSATVTETTITAAQSGDASLIIDSVKGNASSTSSSVSLTMQGTNVPLIYNAAAAPTTTTTLSAFKESFVNYTIDNLQKYSAVPEKSVPGTIQAVTGNAGSGNAGTEIYVTNIGGKQTGITANVVISDYVYTEATVTDGASVVGLFTKTGETYAAATGTKAEGTTYYSRSGNPFLRVAMFVADENATDYTYVGTWAANTANQAVKYAQHFATGYDAATGIGATTTLVDGIEAGQNQITHNSYNATVNTAVNIKSSLAAGAAIKVAVVVWFEGDSLNNAHAGTTDTFTITFQGVTAA